MEVFKRNLDVVYDSLGDREPDSDAIVKALKSLESLHLKLVEKYREKEQESRDHCDKIAALMSGGAGDR